jgi:oxygen-independent coproporphyrinogen-3 oxidase
MSAGFGLYLHWPFCTRICPYCDFNVYRARGADSAPLLAAMIADLQAHAALLGARQIDTIYFGGGTPSLLGPGEIAQLIEAAARAFPLAPDAEITLEANPDERGRFADFIGAGINRLSLGAQSLRDEALAALGRTHDAAAVKDAAERAAQTGARVSADFIYARAGQTLAEWRAELVEALRLPIEHFSLYELTIKSGTAFERAVSRGALTPPDDETAARFYELTQNICDRYGAPAYEISNHARTAEARARHNLIYWRSGEWLGLGPGAHGRIEHGGVRHATKAVDTPAGYIARIAETGFGWEISAALSEQECAQERVIMGLRTDEGVPRAGLNASAIETLAQAGLVTTQGERIALTRAGRLLADRVAAEVLA